MADHRSRTALANSPRAVGRIMEPHNKRMQLTKLRAAPVLQAEVPPCAPAAGWTGAPLRS